MYPFSLISVGTFSVWQSLSEISRHLTHSIFFILFQDCLLFSSCQSRSWTWSSSCRRPYARRWRPSGRETRERIFLFKVCFWLEQLGIGQLGRKLLRSTRVLLKSNCPFEYPKLTNYSLKGLPNSQPQYWRIRECWRTVSVVFYNFVARNKFDLIWFDRRLSRTDFQIFVFLLHCF